MSCSIILCLIPLISGLSLRLVLDLQVAGPGHPPVSALPSSGGYGCVCYASPFMYVGAGDLNPDLDARAASTPTQPSP